MIVVNVCSTWVMVEIKTRLQTWRKTIELNGVSFFLISYIKALMAYLCSQRAPNAQIKYFVFDSSIYRLFVLDRSWKRDSLQIIVLVYICSACCVVELKTWFVTWKTWNDINGVSSFHLSYLVTFMAYLCSQRTPNVQIKYIMFDWSFYRLFLLNRGLKRVSPEIMVFVYVCSTWDIVEQKRVLRRE
jgi:hypothetical protein